MKRLFIKLLVVFSFLLVFFGGFPSIARAEAASLFLEPESGSYQSGNQFSVKIRVDSDGAPINAAKAKILFPTNLLEVQSISKSGSIFQLWPEEPVFSNSRGDISFTGGLPAPGFTGVGTILTINFKGKQEGKAKVSFDEGMVLKADGRGTNILESLRGGTYTIKPGVPETPGLPGKPKITSPTHPNEDRWYNNSNPEFQWKIPSDIIGISIKFDKNSETQPEPKSEELFNSKNYEKVEDGIWYFHLRVQGQVGWSETSHYKVQIDTTPPSSFDTTIDNGGDPTNPQPLLHFEAKDDLSGISHYEIKLGEGDTSSIPLGEINPFKLPLQLPGNYKILVNAIDQAGNRTQSETILEITSIQPPEILIYPEAYTASEETFYVEGRALPNATVIIFFAKGGKLIKNWETLSDQNGNWSFSTEELFRSGDYLLFAKTKDYRGAVSNPSSEYKVKVILAGISIGPWLISYFTLFLILVILIIFLAVGSISIILSKKKKNKERLIKEVKEAEESLKKNFDKLRKDLELRIEYFDSKPGLNQEEKKLRDALLFILKNSEKSVSKEIEDIERELK